MSRVAKKEIKLPNGVEVSVEGTSVSVKGKNGTLHKSFHKDIVIHNNDGVILCTGHDNVDGSWSQAGTARAILNNMIQGVSEGFVKKLRLVGVGYRAQAQGQVLNLSLGFSHPIAHQIPAGITVETPSQTEILIKGADKQVVGQVASEVRAYRPPEPYKGKGVKYEDEVILRKEAKKK